MTVVRKKLIEVALPLEAINAAAAREKSIRHGHPSTLHLWWARRPLAAARAVIFAQMVDDPSAHPDLFPTEKKQAKERERLFEIIRDLVKWESTTNEAVLQAAREEIWQSWRRACAENADHPRAKELFDRKKLPAFHDPFAGGGALPLEAQRLGLEAYASDLNPVAVLINKAMIEIPPRFADKQPVRPAGKDHQSDFIERNWRGAEGLAEDVRYYGQWVRDEAEKRIGQLYPKVAVTAEMAKARPDLEQYVGKHLTVIAWIWARTVKSPNPAFAKVDVPLTSTFILSNKAGKEAFVEPVIEQDGYRFTVRVGKPKGVERVKSGTKLSRGANFECLMSGAPIAPDHVYGEAKAGRMAARLMAIVAEGERGRVYLEPTSEHERAALQAIPDWKPDVAMPENPRWFSPPLYGLRTYGDLFTHRQLVALTTVSALVQEVRAAIQRDAIAAGLPDDKRPLRDGGSGATAYGEAVGVYLGFQVDQLANHLSTVCAWHVNNEQLKNTFARQAIPMVWDFAETNPLSASTGSLGNLQERQVKGLLSLAPYGAGSASSADASIQSLSKDRVVSTDPPYYDNIGYADLSDFFYVWLRRSLRVVFPDLFATVAVPKAEELVATPYRHGSKQNAEAFFLDGMTRAMKQLSAQAHSAFPVTIYYAFKQSESDEDGTSSTGWDTFLAAVIEAGFSISGTWPMRTEQTAAMKTGTNALASSIILVCRPRAQSAPTATRREFVGALKAELPAALADLQRGNIAPVDLAQAAIGPGMAVYTRYASVVDAEGKPLRVREALSLINQTLDEVLTEQEGDFDADSRFALAWFEQYGFTAGEFGVANLLAQAKNAGMNGLAEAGILESSRSKVRLRRPEELPEDWDPSDESRLTAWEIVHHLVRVLGAEGESGAAALVAKLGGKAETARELAYRLYVVSERKKRAAEAMQYNGLVQSWPEILRVSQQALPPAPPKPQMDAFEPSGG